MMRRMTREDGGKDKGEKTVMEGGRKEGARQGQGQGQELKARGMQWRCCLLLPASTEVMRVAVDIVSEACKCVVSDRRMA